jgi:hypothetical protein
LCNSKIPKQKQNFAKTKMQKNKNHQDFIIFGRSNSKLRALLSLGQESFFIYKIILPKSKQITAKQY